MALNPNAPDQIYQAFANHGPAIQTALVSSAQSLFIDLAVIEFVWVVGWTFVHRGDIFDILIVIFRQTILIGFWQFLLTNWVAIAKAITDSFGMFANNAIVAAGGTANMMPMGFLVAGLNLAHNVWNGTSLGTPFISAALLIAGIIDVVIFAWIAAQIMLVLIEAFLASYLGTILMAFGVLSFTRDFGVSQVRYAISVGVKRMTLQMIAGLSEVMVNGFITQIQAAGSNFSWGDVGIMIVVPILLATIAYIAPKIAQDMIMGTHLSTSAGILSTGRMIGNIAGSTALSVLGGGAAATAGLRAAGRQMQASMDSGTAPATSIGRAAAITGMAARNTAGAVASDVGKRLTGSYGASHGYRGWRIASSLNQK